MTRDVAAERKLLAEIKAEDPTGHSAIVDVVKLFEARCTSVRRLEDEKGGSR